MYKIITPDDKTVYDKKTPEGDQTYTRKIMLLGSPQARVVTNDKNSVAWQKYTAQKFIYQELKERVDKSMLPELDFYMIDDYNIGNMSWLVEKVNQADYILLYLDLEPEQLKTVDFMLYSMYTESSKLFTCYTQDTVEHKLYSEFAKANYAQQNQEYPTVKDAASAMLDKLIQSILE